MVQFGDVNRFLKSALQISLRQLLLRSQELTQHDIVRQVRIVELSLKAVHSRRHLLFPWTVISVCDCVNRLLIVLEQALIQSVMVMQH